MDKNRNESKMEPENAEETMNTGRVEPKDYVHEPQSELVRGTGGHGFVGILFALAALCVLFWIYSRLIEPYPGHQTPNEAAAAVSKQVEVVKTAEAGAETGSPADLQAGDIVNNKKTSSKSSPLGIAHDMSKMAPGETMPIEQKTGKSEFETRLASFAEDKCATCGMTPSKSSAMVAAEFDGKWIGFDSLACYFDYAKGKKLAHAEILDYSTRDRDAAERSMVELDKAYFLIGLDGSIRGSMPPAVAGFATETDAQAAIGDLGGRVARFDDMKKFIEEEG